MEILLFQVVCTTHVISYNNKNDEYENSAGTQLFTVNPFYAFLIRFSLIFFFLQVFYMLAAALSEDNCERPELGNIIHFIGGRIYNMATEWDI